MPQKIMQVDAFSDRPFGGNPAAVCVLDAPADERWMQAIAMEMNLSETAFLTPEQDGYNLRWFTPTAEVDLCGHATLASAHTLWSEGYVSPNQELRFYTRSGRLTATRKDDWITLNFPEDPPTPASPTPELLKSLPGARPVYTGKSKSKYLVELPSEKDVRALQPDFALIKQLAVMGVIVTSPSDSPEFDFVSRFFAPAIGIDEDPVTGAAHCVLTPYWSKLGKPQLQAYQASARGGVLKLKQQGDRIFISGQAVTVMRAELI